MLSESTIRDTLVQHNPFSGSLLDSETGNVVCGVHDFVGTFNISVVTDDVPPEELSGVVVERIAEQQIAVSFSSYSADVVLNVHELHDKDAGTGTGYWLSTYVMLPWLLALREKLAGKKVLELGAGGGLIGIALATSLFQVASITITDHVPCLYELIVKNVAENEATLIREPIVAQLDWEDDEALSGQTYDVIVGSDCVFRQTRPAFTRAVFRHLKAGGDLYVTNAPPKCRPGVDDLVYALSERGDVELVSTRISMAGTWGIGQRVAEGVSHHKEMWIIRLSDFERDETPASPEMLAK